MDADPLSTSAGERILRGAAIPAPQIGDRFGRFTLTRFIGRGSFGSVFEAEQDAPVRRRVAVKVLTGAERSEQAERRFDAERRALASLSHAGIAQILDGGVSEDGTPWFAMELVEGKAIDEFSDSAGLDASSRIELVRQACEAADFAHRRGILHRDLKPGNVLVQDRPGGGPRVKIVDFGLAKVLEGESPDLQQSAGEGEQIASPPDATRAGQVLGTPAYMSPEGAALDPSRIDARSDVYALAAIAVRLLVGEPPHPVRSGEGDAAYISRIRRGDVGDIVARLRRRGVPRCADLGAVLGRALSADPADRYQGAAELGEELGRWQSGFPVRAARTGALGRGVRLVRRNPAASLLVAVLVVGLVGAVVVAWQQARQAQERQLDAERRADAMRAAIEPLLDGVQLSKAADESLEARARLVRVFEEVYGPDHPKTNSRRMGYAVSLRGARRFDEAIDQYRLLLDVAARAGLRMESKGAQRILGDWADTLRMKGDIGRAMAMAEECVLIADALNDGCDGNFQQARLALVCMLMAIGDAERAVEQAQCAVELLARCQPEATGQRVIAESLMADALMEVGREQEGRVIVADLRERSSELVAAIPSLRGVAREWAAQGVLESAEAIAARDPIAALMIKATEAEALRDAIRRESPAGLRLSR